MFRAAAASALIIPSLVAAPCAAHEDDGQIWLQLNTNVRIAPRTRLTLEQIARFSDDMDGLYQTEIGGLVSYRIRPAIELGAGYRYVGAYNGSTASDEHRIRQQVVATSGRWYGRFRVDERFPTHGGEVGFRIRPLVRYNYPLGEGAHTALFVSHESFFLPNTTRWGQRRGYERMRNIAGVTFPIGRSLAADVGYLNQYRFARGGNGARMDHAVTMQLTINLADSIIRHADD